MVDRNSKTLRRETSNSFKRSVPSMKSLLPLKLVSTTLPQSDIWLSTSQDQRSTFGAILPTKESSEVKGKTNNPFGLRLSHLPSRQPQRDTPIYNEPGSPLPGRAYYTSDDLCINCSSPGLSCVDGCVFNYRRSTDIQARENEFENEFASQSNTVYATDIHRRSNVSDAPRSSGMSFQCTGEVMVPSEAAWLSTPLPNSPKSKLVRRRSTLNQPLEMSVESWLSDTAAELGENVLACATAVSPSKAQVVEINTYRLSEEGLPPRVSSLNAPCSANLPVGRYSWTPSDDSPPDTPTDEWEFDDRRSPRKEPQWIFPSRPYDLAMNSPPISPKVIPDPPAASRFSYLVMSVGIEIGADPNMTSRWSLDSTTSEEKSNIDIMTDLEDIVSGFPTNMLLPDTPCISEIRLGLGNANPERSSHDTSYLTHEPRTYFTNLNDRKSIANFSRPRRTDNLSSSRSTPMVQPTAWRSSYISSSSTIQPATRLPTPDLAPLSRIFPNGSEYAHLGLYAHMIAYIFLTSLPTPSPQLENLPRRRRRDTPYWTPAQGGQPHMSISYSQANESSLKSRSLDLKTKLRKCIFRLMNNMDSSICQDNGDGRAELMLRAVEEVVRASEKLSSTATH
ncbi:hypothetical protein BKA64DRAFT_713336 [Cadophora sp. MPI-SDFR-AT-0126]|nr:hypothetical protein BKA64DRAFT_713336 [Leotiomycetes sp. MPI-SDFR-AT-0126]